MRSNKVIDGIVTYQQNLQVKCVRRHEDAVIPSRAHESDVGYDLTAIKKHKVLDNGVILYDTGIAIKPPANHYIEIVARSSISKSGYMIANGVGTIDPNYTGNLYIALVRVVEDAPELELPFCKCQFVIRKCIYADILEVENLEDTDRGAGSFGSTGSRLAMG